MTREELKEQSRGGWSWLWGGLSLDYLKQVKCGAPTHQVKHIETRKGQDKPHIVLSVRPGGRR